MIIKTLKTNFQKHIYYEDCPQSKAYNLNNALSILGLLAFAEDRLIRIKAELNLYREIGIGDLIKKYIHKIEITKAAIVRIKERYNKDIKALELF